MSRCVTSGEEDTVVSVLTKNEGLLTRSIPLDLDCVNLRDYRRIRKCEVNASWLEHCTLWVKFGVQTGGGSQKNAYIHFMIM